MELRRKVGAKMKGKLCSMELDVVLEQRVVSAEGG